MVGRKSSRMIVIFLAPALLIYALIFLYPVIRTFVMSFYSMSRMDDPMSEWAFIGFGNFAHLFSDPLFVRSATNYITIWFVGGVAVILLAMIFAVILTSGLRLNRFWRSMIYLPNVITAIALGTMWLQYVYKDYDGLVDKAAALFGGHPTQMLGPDKIIWSLLIAYSFGMVGYIMLTFISGIEKISAEFYEASSIEGANVFQKFFFITLPLIKGVIRSNLVIWTVALGTGVFAWSFMFSPNNITLGTAMPQNYMYELLFSSRSSGVKERYPGAGAAVGLMVALLVVAVSLITTIITRRDDVEM